MYSYAHIILPLQCPEQIQNFLSHRHYKPKVKSTRDKRSLFKIRLRPNSHNKRLCIFACTEYVQSVGACSVQSRPLKGIKCKLLSKYRNSLYFCREGNGCNTGILGLETSYFHLTKLSSMFSAFRAVIGSVLIQYYALQ